MKRISVRIILLTMLLMLLSLLKTENKICCMFASVRTYGFPWSWLSLSKVTDSLEEANKVKSLPFFELSKQGWHLGFNSDPNAGLGVWPWLNLLLDILFFLVISWVISQFIIFLVNSRSKLSFK